MLYKLQNPNHVILCRPAAAAELGSVSQHQRSDGKTTSEQCFGVNQPKKGLWMQSCDSILIFWPILLQHLQGTVAAGVLGLMGRDPSCDLWSSKGPLSAAPGTGPQIVLPGFRYPESWQKGQKCLMPCLINS